MRVLFGIAKEQDYAECESYMKACGITFVMRHRVTHNEIMRNYVVDFHDFHDNLVPTEWVDSRDTWFEITACNKQYISKCRWSSKPQSLGSMCQVTSSEAMEHVFDFGASFRNWYLIDTADGRHWIAANRNPNRVGNHTSPGITDDEARWPRDPRCPVMTAGC